MVNPFANISDPKQLRAMVQDGVECERCGGRQWPQIGPDACPVCCGPGKIPGKVSLPNADLDALAACWCEGEWIEWRTMIGGAQRWCILSGEAFWRDPPAYTTDPAAAMPFMVKYDIGIGTYLDGWGRVFTNRHGISVTFKEDTVSARCHAITTAALVAALTEAMEGASE